MWSGFLRVGRLGIPVEAGWGVGYNAFMFGFGIWELLIILVMILVLFGRKLPELGEGLGRGIRNFRKSVREPDEIDVTPKERERKNQKEESS